jgi:hypothetical protein
MVARGLDMDRNACIVRGRLPTPSCPAPRRLSRRAGRDDARAELLARIRRRGGIWFEPLRCQQRILDVNRVVSSFERRIESGSRVNSE